MISPSDRVTAVIFRAFAESCPLLPQENDSGRPEPFSGHPRNRGQFGVEFYLGLLPVHQLPCVGDRRAECGADGLMAQADAEDGDLVPRAVTTSMMMPAFSGLPGPGERMIRSGVKPVDFL